MLPVCVRARPRSPGRTPTRTERRIIKLRFLAARDRIASRNRGYMLAQCCELSGLVESSQVGRNAGSVGHKVRLLPNGSLAQPASDDRGGSMVSSTRGHPARVSVSEDDCMMSERCLRTHVTIQHERLQRGLRRVVYRAPSNDGGYHLVMADSEREADSRDSARISSSAGSLAADTATAAARVRASRPRCVPARAVSVQAWAQ